ncbi:MAG: hypothetical protein ACTHQM_13575 [Thermoanaerobaculia bacterium]
MKKSLLFTAIFVLAAPLAMAELSPDRNHVVLAKSVPRECLEQGSFETSTMKYTCTKVDTSEVWNDLELAKFDKDIFEASRQPKSVEKIGLVVRQDSMYTRAVPAEQNEVAFVERRDGYKYRYTRR